MAVTGQNGVLGSLLTQRLQENGVFLDKFPGDVSDATEIKQWIGFTRPDAMFHLAAIVPVTEVDADPFAAMRVNATALAAIQEAIAKSTPETWLFLASSSHVYKAATRLRGSYRKVSETSVTEPLSLYGATKLAGERILVPLARSCGTQLCVGRIFSYFHERQSSSFLVPGLISRIENAPEESVIAVRDADAIRDFLYADMVIDAMLLLWARRANVTVNIGSGHATSVGAIAERIRVMSRKNIHLNFLPSQNVTGLVANTKTLRHLISTGLSE